MDVRYYDLTCAWCGVTIARQTVENSHGICPPCHNRVLNLPNLSSDELDALAFGVIGLDRDGVVIEYNEREQRLAMRDKADVIGKCFFDEVAPCTKVRNFYGRFLELVEGKGADPACFEFVFAFTNRETRVRITMVRAKEAPVAHEKIPAVWVLVEAMSESTEEKPESASQALGGTPSETGGSDVLAV